MPPVLPQIPQSRAHLRPHQQQQGAVDRQQLNVDADGGLVEGTCFTVQFVETRLTHGVRAAQADGFVSTSVELVQADGAGQELCPLRRLHGHPGSSGGRSRPSRDHMTPGFHRSYTPAERQPRHSSIQRVITTIFSYNCVITITSNSSGVNLNA